MLRDGTSGLAALDEPRRRRALAAPGKRPCCKDRRHLSSLPALKFLFLGGFQGANSADPRNRGDGS
jgi:hypothetical protein